MSVKIIQDRLNSYQCQSHQEEEYALKEIVQEIALSALARTDFFKTAAFQGGTALRILYGIQRFSEDLDFILKKPDRSFDWENYGKHLEKELQIYDMDISLQDKTKAGQTVKKMFLKDDSIGKILTTKYRFEKGTPRKIRVKFEIDTNPPAGSHWEIKYPDFPFPFAVSVQDPPSLFAGKCHALLSREYTKGRDWYDLIWYTSRKIQVNYPFLGNALIQMGPWKGKRLKVTKKWFLKEMAAKIKTTDFNVAKKDIARFLKPRDLAVLNLWTHEFFADRLDKMTEYLKGE